MDFYFDIGMAVIMRILRDRRNVAKFYTALAKLYVELSNLMLLDPRFLEVVKNKQREP